jgi:hypothetical protein
MDVLDGDTAAQRSARLLGGDALLRVVMQDAEVSPVGHDIAQDQQRPALASTATSIAQPECGLSDRCGTIRFRARPVRQHLLPTA